MQFLWGQTETRTLSIPVNLVKMQCLVEKTMSWVLANGIVLAKRQRTNDV